MKYFQAVWESGLSFERVNFFSGSRPDEFSLSVKPLEPKRQTYAEEKAYSIARVDERYLNWEIYLDAEQAALNLLRRDMERELARSTLELEQKKFELVKRRQELGEASFQDVQDQLVDLIAARQSLFIPRSSRPFHGIE